MNYGVIDLGSNTVRLSVYRYENQRVERIFTRKDVVGLATYVDNGILSKEGIDTAVSVLKSFKELASLVNVPNVYVFATASLRNINNGKEAADLIEKNTGLIVDILSGDDEATLGFKGISHIMNIDNALMIDIGGSSTELVLVEKGVPVNFTSMPIGCLNTYLKYVSEMMPTGEEIRDIKSLVKTHLEKIDWKIKGNPKTIEMIGVGGTCRASQKLANRLFKLGKREFVEYEHLRQIGLKIKNNAIKKNGIYHEIYKTVPDRILTMPSGMTILRSAMKKFDIDRITVSEYGVREGYFIDRVIK